MKTTCFLVVLAYAFVTHDVFAADTKISALPSASALAGTEDVPAVQSAATVKTTPAAIDTYVKTLGATLGVAKGGTNLTSSTDDNTIVGNGTTWESKALSNCGDASHALSYATSTNTWGCQSITDLGATLGVAHGGTNLTAATDDSAMIGNGTTWESKAVPNCGDSTHALAYATSTNTFSCQSVTGSGGSPGGSDTQIQFNDSSAFGGDADFTWSKTTNILTIGSAATPASVLAPAASGASAGPTLSLTAGTGGASSGAGGTVSVVGGAAGGGNANGGGVLIKSGAVAGNQVSGDINLQVGSKGAGGTYGTLRLNDGGGNQVLAVTNSAANFDAIIATARATDSGVNGQSYGVGYVGYPNNTQNADYTLVLADRGKMLLKTDSTARNYTIPAQASVVYKIGTHQLICNANATANAVIKADNSNNRLYVAGSNTTTTGLAVPGFRCAEIVYMGPGSDSFEDWVGFLMP